MVVTSTRRVWARQRVSSLLGEAIDTISHTVMKAAAPGGPPTFDRVLAAARQDAPDESRLHGLARRVLRSTLEQLRARQGKHAGW